MYQESNSIHVILRRNHKNEKRENEKKILFGEPRSTMVTIGNRGWGDNSRFATKFNTNYKISNR